MTADLRDHHVARDEADQLVRGVEFVRAGGRDGHAVPDAGVVGGGVAHRELAPSKGRRLALTLDSATIPPAIFRMSRTATLNLVAELHDDPRITAIGLFAEAFTGLSARFAAQLAGHKLSPVEFEVLMRLARSPGHELRMTDLAAQTSLSTSGVTRVVDRMERDGLLRRRACPTDRRSSYAGGHQRRYDPARPRPSRATSS